MEKRPRLRFLAGREDAGSTPDPAAPKLFGEFSKKLIIPLMGHSYFIECQKCDYKSEEITMGVGFLFGNIDDILHALRGNDKKTCLHIHSPNPIIPKIITRIRI